SPVARLPALRARGPGPDRRGATDTRRSADHAFPNREEKRGRLRFRPGLLCRRDPVPLLCRGPVLASGRWVESEEQTRQEAKSLVELASGRDESEGQFHRADNRPDYLLSGGSAGGFGRAARAGASSRTR